jgi:class 3 adenylate cyclase
MQCPHCRHANSPDATFCDECGTRLDAGCSVCGETNRGGAKFCRKCGRSLIESGAAEPTARSRFGPPRSYTPPHLAEKILTSRGTIEGERKQVTVLFADVKGSMELLAERDPEEAHRLLDPVLEHMMEAVHRYEGTVNQVMGDGIMALFGAPLAHEDHAVRACYAALRMQESVRRHAEGTRRATGIPIQIRVGLNSGEVVVREVGSDLRMDYSAIGQTVHLAARMEQMATPGAILIAADSLALAEGYVEAKALGGEGDAQAGHRGRERGGQYDLHEDGAPGRSEGQRRLHQVGIDPPHAGDRVEEDQEEPRVPDDEDLPGLVDAKPQNGQRDPGEGDNEAERLHHRLTCQEEPARPAEQDAEWHGRERSEREARSHAEEADEHGRGQNLGGHEVGGRPAHGGQRRQDDRLDAKQHGDLPGRDDDRDHAEEPQGPAAKPPPHVRHACMAPAVVRRSGRGG